jgi:hypothetical protein
MSTVVPFPQSPLKPYLGEWILDQISISRNKLSRLLLGEDGVKKLWACGSIEELRQLAADDPVLANKYQSLLRNRTESRLKIASDNIAWNPPYGQSIPSIHFVYPVVRISPEGNAVVVHSLDPRAERRGRPAGLRLRMRKNWLLVSEEYFGRQADLFPRAQVLRFYPAKTGAVP